MTPEPQPVNLPPASPRRREMTGRGRAALGSLAFLVLAPGVVAGLIPWLITRWGPLPPSDGPGALRWTGLILIAAGLAVVLDAFARFALEGLGTPAPVAPTRTLVVTGDGIDPLSHATAERCRRLGALRSIQG